jgi:enamine deaminase RidA (YjgF/YER057c/UK114 family)
MRHGGSGKDDRRGAHRPWHAGRPARATIVCPLANPDFLLEIECVAQAEVA